MGHYELGYLVNQSGYNQIGNCFGTLKETLQVPATSVRYVHLGKCTGDTGIPPSFPVAIGAELEQSWDYVPVRVSSQTYLLTYYLFTYLLTYFLTYLLTYLLNLLTYLT